MTEQRAWKIIKGLGFTALEVRRAEAFIAAKYDGMCHQAAQLKSKEAVYHGADYDDAYQAARLGLAISMERFDPSRGCRFITLAFPNLYHEVEHMLRDCRFLKASGHRDLLALKAFEDREEARTGHLPSIEEVCAHTGWTKDRANRNMVGRVERFASFSQITAAPGRVSGEDDRSAFSIADMGQNVYGVSANESSLARMNLPADEQLGLDRLLHSFIPESLNTLDSYERRVFDAYYSGEPCTYQQVGDALGLSKQRAQQIMEVAVRKVRQFHVDAGAASPDVLHSKVSANRKAGAGVAAIASNSARYRTRVAARAAVLAGSA